MQPPDASVLVTGATGFLGREILLRVLAREPTICPVVLVRAADEAALAARLNALLAGVDVRARERMEVVRGDVCEPLLGLGREAYATLAGRVDRVVHVAATTRFDLPLERARRVNVGGTAHVLAFARAIRARGGSGRVDHVSTAYVAGRRTDVVREDELAAPHGFRNTYEQSKFEAEQLCRAAQRELPLAIHRPSVIVGDSATGLTRSWRALYWPLRHFARVYALWWPVMTRLAPLPLDAGTPVDLVPVDWVADAVARLSGCPDAAGRCYHLAAGVEGAVTVGDLVRIGCAHLGVPPLRFLRPGPRRLAGRVARALARPVAPRFVRQAEFLLAYAFEQPRFDTTNARAAGLEAPPVASYFARLLDYAFAADFGRRPAAPSA